MLKFMKNKILIPTLVLLTLGVFFSFRYGSTANEPDQIENQTILQTVMAILNEGHFSPRELDDQFSRKVFDATIENLDYDKKFFLADDIARLGTAHRDKIDDQIRNNSLDFFNDLNEVFVQRVEAAKSYYPEILSQSFDFTGKEEIQLDGKKLDFVKSEPELKNRWEKSLKYRVLSKYYDLKETQDKKIKDSADYTPKDLVTLEKDARESIAKIQDRYFKRLEKLNDNDRFALFMNSLTSAEDPHTNYMPPADKKRFMEMMSGSFIGIGASLMQQEDGRVVINEIITGSPSWKQGQLKKNDEIRKVAQGAELPVDVEGMDLEDVVKIIRGPEGTEVRLHVKHENGTFEEIAIIRGKVELEDVFAKSAIIEEEGKRIGYIYLPEFYADFNGISDRRSAEDVKKEVLKLKAEKVQGIVLDLRNNGGGSLSDVVDMVGLFVGSGPVVQVVSSEKNVRIMKSRIEQPVYTGPLAIMINGNSASASEIMAAAMQDYGRAVVIGSESFGKGTVQNLVPLDRFVNSSMRERIIAAFNRAKGDGVDYDGIGSLKLTIQKFYRINGGSTQLKGVVPDIILPDVYDQIDMGERRESSALPWDKIAPAPYSVWKNQPPIAYLKTESADRVKDNEIFDLIKTTAVKIKEQRDNNIMPLSLSAYIQKQEENQQLSNKMDMLDSMGKPLHIVNLKADLERINLDSTSITKNEKWLSNLEKDIYLHETASILGDWFLKAGKLVGLEGKVAD